ncbi:MAG: hypothetical protein JRH20_18075, partial [Deltaproteobacteria bacterium]|nr:hypothetical protein [Deltaproteobacteria bacterium]
GGGPSPKSAHGGGGGHGGAGGASIDATPGGTANDWPGAPVRPGSGGGGGTHADGGDGGGVIRLLASSEIIVAGLLSVHGLEGPYYSGTGGAGGGGAGGTIALSAPSVSGAGVLSALGGAAGHMATGAYSGGGGGGGLITVDATSDSFTGESHITGGAGYLGSSPGEDGVVTHEVGTHAIHRLFVSSTTYAGDALATADNLCEQIARREQFVGRWKALVSTTGLSANSALVIRTPVYNFRPQGLGGAQLLASDQTGFWDGALDNAITYEERGAASTEFVWTGTTADGQHSGNSCGDWSSTSGIGEVGDPTVADSRWVTDQVGSLCSRPLAIYCISQ